MESVRDVVMEFLDTKQPDLSANTLRIYRFALAKMLEFFDSVGVTEMEHINRRVLLKLSAWTQQQPNCHAKKEEPVSPGAAHNRLRPVKTFIIWAKYMGILEHNPFSEHLFSRDFLPKLKEAELEVVRPDEFHRLMQVAQKTRNPLRDTAILALLYDTGIRVSDLCGLRLQDLNREPGAIHVEGSKGGKTRDIPLSRQVRNRLNDYIRRERPEVPFEQVFVSTDGFEPVPINRNTVRLLLTRLCQKANVAPKSPHAFRRGFTVMMDRAGAPRKATQDILGHSSARMTDHYSRLNIEDLKHIHRQASPLNFVLTGGMRIPQD